MLLLSQIVIVNFAARHFKWKFNLKSPRLICRFVLTHHTKFNKGNNCYFVPNGCLLMLLWWSGFCLYQDVGETFDAALGKVFRRESEAIRIGSIDRENNDRFRLKESYRLHASVQRKKRLISKDVIEQLTGYEICLLHGIFARFQIVPRNVLV